MKTRNQLIRGAAISKPMPLNGRGRRGVEQRISKKVSPTPKGRLSNGNKRNSNLSVNQNDGSKKLANDTSTIQKQMLAQEIQKTKQLEATLGKLNKQVSNEHSKMFKTTNTNNVVMPSSPSFHSLPTTALKKKRTEVHDSPMQLLSSVSTTILEEKQQGEERDISSSSITNVNHLLGLQSAVGGDIYIPESTSHQQHQQSMFNHRESRNLNCLPFGCEEVKNRNKELSYCHGGPSSDVRLEFTSSQMNSRQHWQDSGESGSSGSTKIPSLSSSSSSCSWKTNISPLSDESSSTKKAIRQIIDISNGVVKEEDNDATKHIVKKCFRERIWPEIKFLTDEMIRDMGLEQGEDESVNFGKSVLGKLLRATKKEHYGYTERFRCWSLWSKYGQSELNTKKSNVTKQIKAEVLSGKNNYFISMPNTICQFYLSLPNPATGTNVCYPIYLTINANRTRKGEGHERKRSSVHELQQQKSRRFQCI